MNNIWSKSDIELLEKEFPTTTKDEICEMFPDRTYISIYKKANKLGLYRTDVAKYKTACDSRKKIPYDRNPQISSKGYIRVYAPNNQRANKNGMVLEHILVWETENNMCIPNGYVVHHINGNKQDNRIENLLLMEQGEHTSYHNSHRKLTNDTKNKISIKAKERYSNKCNHPRYKNVNIFEMQKAIENGETVKSICEKYGINKTTYYKKIKGDYQND